MRRSRYASTETPVDLLLWPANGCIKDGNYDWEEGRRRRKAPEWPQVSVGRTDSKRRLGFSVQMSPKTPEIRFTLDRVQVANLRDHLIYQLKRLKRGASRKQVRS